MHTLLHYCAKFVLPLASKGNAKGNETKSSDSPTYVYTVTCPQCMQRDFLCTCVCIAMANSKAMEVVGVTIFVLVLTCRFACVYV